MIKMLCNFAFTILVRIFTHCVLMKCPRLFYCTGDVVAWGLRIADLHAAEWSVGFQRKLLLYGRAALFLPLEQPSSFQGAFPGSNVEGRGDYIWLKTDYFCIGCCLSFIFYKLFFFSLRKTFHRRLKLLGGNQPSQKWRKLQPNRLACFFFFFFFLWLKPLFSHTWILTDEIGRVYSLSIARTVVYVDPGLRMRIESHSSAALQGERERHAGATSCPQSCEGDETLPSYCASGHRRQISPIFSAQLLLWIIAMERRITLRRWNKEFWGKWRVSCS